MQTIKVDTKHSERGLPNTESPRCADSMPPFKMNVHKSEVEIAATICFPAPPNTHSINLWGEKDGEKFKKKLYTLLKFAQN